MSKQRFKVTGPSIRSRADAERVLGDIRAATISRNQATADRDRERKTVNDSYLPAISKLTQDIEGLSEQLRNWAEANEPEFKGLKSIEMTHGQVGWRIGNPTLKTITGWTWDRVLEKLQSSPLLERFVRTKAEVNKQAILDERESFPADDLRAMGVKVAQDEAFFVEPKLDETDNRTVLREAA